MPSDMMRDDDLVDDDFQGNAYAPFLPSRSVGARRAVTSPGTYRFVYALLGLVILGAVGVHLLAPTGASVTVLQAAVGVLVVSLLLALAPETAVLAGVGILLSGYIGIVAAVSYFAAFHG